MEHKLKKGYVQVYTGTGKGKTTAAIGLAVRAAGCGMQVFIGQFVKGMKYSEIKCLGLLKDNITVRQYGLRCFIRKDPTEEDIKAAMEGFADAKEMMLSGKYDLVILDEITIAEYFGLITTDDIIDLIDSKPEHVELVLTGRKTSQKIIEMADLVTEMREIKHYYNEGVPARKGIEK
jgi:cob(I)alamin adenosyltransferase